MDFLLLSCGCLLLKSNSEFTRYLHTNWTSRISVSLLPPKWQNKHSNFTVSRSRTRRSIGLFLLFICTQIREVYSLQDGVRTVVRMTERTHTQSPTHTHVHARNMNTRALAHNVKAKWKNAKRFKAKQSDRKKKHTHNKKFQMQCIRNARSKTKWCVRAWLFRISRKQRMTVCLQTNSEFVALTLIHEIARFYFIHAWVSILFSSVFW